MFDIAPGESDAACITDDLNASIAVQSHMTATRYNHDLESALAAVLETGTSAEWINDGNEELQAATIVFAKAFIESLPAGFQNPAIEPEPDGDISIEWYRGKRKTLTASISPVGRIAWAALIGSEDTRGSVNFTGKTPETILFHLSRILT
jgi:hypothetical protein